MTTRRTLIATGLFALAGTSISLPAPAQSKRSNVQTKQFKSQAKMALSVMQDGNAVGALLLGNTLNNWAAYVEENGLDNTVRQLVRKHGRVRGTMNHKEVENLAKELGVDSLISIHTDVVFDVNEVYNEIVFGEPLSARMRNTANQIVLMSSKWKGGNIITIQSWDYQQCYVCQLAARFHEVATMICEVAAGAAIIPGAAQTALEVCGIVMADYYMLEAACQLTRIFGCD